SGEVALAEKELEAALPEWEQVTGRYPQIAEHRRMYGATLNNLALLLHRRGEPARALELVRGAVREQVAALRIEPSDLDGRRHLREHYGWMSNWLPPDRKQTMVTPLTSLVELNEKQARSGQRPNLRELADSQLALAELLRLLKRPADARTLYEHGVKIRS